MKSQCLPPLRRPAALRGAGTLEVALLLAAVVGALLLGMALIGISTHNVYQLLADASMFGTQPQSPIPRVANNEARRAQPDHAEPSRWGVPTAAVLLLAASLGLLKRRRRKVRRVAAALNEGTEATADRTMLFARRQEILKSMTGDWRSLLTDRLTVRHVMSRRFRVVEPSLSRDQLREVLRVEQVQVVLVCDAEGRLLGTVGWRTLAEGKGSTAGQIMKRGQQTTGPDAPLSPTIMALLGADAPCLAAVKGEKIVGILSAPDVMLALQCTLRLLHRIVAGNDMASLDYQCAQRQTISGQRTVRSEPVPSDQPTVAAVR